MTPRGNREALGQIAVAQHLSDVAAGMRRSATLEGGGYLRGLPRQIPNAAIERHGVEVTLILDFIHVLECSNTSGRPTRRGGALA